ncbi:MAG: phosphoribosylformylglycinamidine synthase subunit PurL [Bdellovibrionota bacterium]
MYTEQQLSGLLKHYRISQAEYELIQKQLGRPPKGLEWALYSALWSEHCSYKSSKVHLRKFASKSKRIVSEEGENAGVIDLGEGERVAFKMESHNHPSFIEPYQGAATGVGGILRDIFTMGARPVMLANYLCFGNPKADRMSSLVDGVVKGISGYGNCVGVPTVTGQTEFHTTYDKNILVNALAVGLFRPGEKIFTSGAHGTGNLVVYVGAKTGKDGVHGASMASESFDDKNEKKKPTIQKGDPFFEKLLIESCLEVMSENLVVAIQDMGAAGLTSSSFEMAAKGGISLKMHLDKVPLRDSSMTPEEILLSESQERMLLICEPSQLKRIQSIFSKWDLDAEQIGEIVDTKPGATPTMQLLWHNEVVCEIDPGLLVNQAPKYERAFDTWAYPNRIDKSLTATWPAGSTVQPKDSSAYLLQLFSDYRGTSRNWIYDQYDQRVGARTASDCSNSVGVIRLPDSKRGLGLVLGCRPFWMRTDAAIGAADAVALPSLELAARGFQALAVTDCLNYGNPENKKIMSEFVASVESMAKQCEMLDAPVISGNVSFYNETLGQNITSTPATGVVGIRQSVEGLPASNFKAVGDDIFVLEYACVQTNGRAGEIENLKPVWMGEYNHKGVADFIKLTQILASVKGVHASRVAGQFGLAYTLARMSLSASGAAEGVGAGLGCDVDLTAIVKTKEQLFTEKLYQVVLAVSPEASSELQKIFNSFKPVAADASAGSPVVQLHRVGVVRGDSLKIQISGQPVVQLAVQSLADKYYNSWEKNFEFMA